MVAEIEVIFVRQQFRPRALRNISRGARKKREVRAIERSRRAGRIEPGRRPARSVGDEKEAIVQRRRGRGDGFRSRLGDPLQRFAQVGSRKSSPVNFCALCVSSPSFEPSPRVHGQEAACNPGERKDAEYQACHVMPQIEPGVGRPASARLHQRLTYAQIDADCGEKAADERGVDDPLAPYPTIAPQFAEIQPMRNGSKPIPKSLTRRGDLHRAAADARYIELRPCSVSKVEEIQGSMTAEFA